MSEFARPCPFCLGDTCGGVRGYYRPEALTAHLANFHGLQHCGRVLDEITAWWFAYPDTPRGHHAVEVAQQFVDGRGGQA